MEQSKKVLRVKKRKKHSKKYYIIEGIRKVIMLVALFTFSYVSYELTNIYLEYKDADEAYADVNVMLSGEDDVISSGGEVETDEEGNVITNVHDGEKWEWDYDSYLRFNSDTKGFIMSEGTPIQYPIMQGSDNDYYLDHLANNIQHKNGSIFIDYKLDTGLEAKNCVIYGHNMRNGAMFGSLQEYADESYWEEHPYMDIYVGYKHYRYYVFAMYTTPINSDTYTIRFKDNKAFLNYIKQCKNKSIYTPDVGKITADDKIITLSTCMDNGDDDYRFIVQLVRREEVTD